MRQVPEALERPLHLIALSARSDHALRSLAGRYRDHLVDRPQERIADVGFTANTGRARFAFRRHRGGSPAEVVHGLDAGDRPSSFSVVDESDDTGPPVAFLFTGNGPQHEKMGRALYETHAGFREDIDRCDEILRPRLARPLPAVLFPADDNDLLLDHPVHAARHVRVRIRPGPALAIVGGAAPRIVGPRHGRIRRRVHGGGFSLEDALTLVDRRLVARRVRYSAPSLVLVSSTTGQVAASEVETEAYWADHSRHPCALLTPCGRFTTRVPSCSLRSPRRRHRSARPSGPFLDRRRFCPHCARAATTGKFYSSRCVGSTSSESRSTGRVSTGITRVVA